MIATATTIKLKDSLSGGFAGQDFNGFGYGAIGGLGMEAYRIGVEVRDTWA